MSEWKAIAGRITIFPAPSSEALPSALDLYKKVWEVDPTNFQGSTTILSPSVAQGKRPSFGLNCSVHPSRIDFALSPSESEDRAEPPKFLVIENSKEFHDELLRIARVIGKGLLTNPILRIATFLQFVSIEANTVEANRTLMSIVPSQYRIKLNDEQEFICQVNRPRASDKMPDLKINLITKWSVDRFQIVSLLFGMGGAAPIFAQSSAAPVVSEFIAATVSFDNNNVPVLPAKPLSSAQQSSLLLEALAHTVMSMQEGGLKITGFENGQLAH